MDKELKSKQCAAVERMLNLNGSSLAADQWSDQWKVLVYDSAGRDIISPLLNVAQLRRNGVTLHMLLDSEREPIPDVPAIYFVRPTTENIERIAKDCKNKLYGSMHLNFISKLERRLMEDLARLVIDAGQFQIITKIFDQHLDFVTLEPRLFSLNHKNSYVSYNGNQSESSINETMKSISNGLFSMLATLEAMPIIRAPPNGPSEMVGRQLNELLASAWSGGSGAVFGTGSTVSSRPLLVLLDRACDFTTVLQHTCTYQAILHDVLNYRMNRVNINEDGVSRTYDLEVENDSFWKKNAPLAFPEAIEDNSKELSKIKELEKEIRSRTAGNDEVNENASGLMATMDTLPELLERKKKVEWHSGILQASMSVIASRQLPVFFDAETSGFEKDKLMELMGSNSQGSLSDKLRLLAVLNLRADTSTTPLINELEETLKQGETSEAVQAELNAGLSAIKHMRQIRQFQSPTPTQVDSSSGGGRLGSWVQSKTAGILGQVQSMLNRSDEIYVTKVIDNLCEFKAGSEDDSFITLDPRRSKSATIDPKVGRTPHRDVIVFMIGGGSYSEYQRIQEYGTTHPERAITYGCTELINGESFLKQLGTL